MQHISFLVVALAIGCGGGTNSSLDMSGPVGCIGYIRCVDTCTKGGIAFLTCRSMCDGMAQRGAPELYDSAIGCGQLFCEGTMDMPGDCVLNGMNQYVDRNGAAVGACKKCLANSLAALYGGTCDPPMAPNCNPMSCKAAVDKCLASTP